MTREIRVEVFHSFDEENRAEDRRRRDMTAAERCAEFAALQERMWGDVWRTRRLVRQATWEWTDW